MPRGATRKPYTRADFLAWESVQKERWEFVDGVMTVKAGGTLAHNTIATSITVALDTALRARDCRVLQHNQKVTPAENEDSAYPDVVVACGAFDDEATFIDRATLIVEVVSESSSRTDYGKKWESYRVIPELRHYLVIERERTIATVWSRMSEEEPWRSVRVEGLDGAVELPALGVALDMRGIYRRTGLAP